MNVEETLGALTDLVRQGKVRYIGSSSYSGSQIVEAQVAAGSGYYSETKAAPEGLSGSLHKELQPLGINVTVIEPGAFRTDFAGRSVTQSATAIADYAETAGKRRKEHDTVHGTQQGDPAKAAEAILKIVESPNPPALMVLGKDAFDAFAAVAQAEQAELDQWRDLSLSTGIGD